MTDIMTEFCKRCKRDLPKSDFFRDRRYWKRCNVCGEKTKKYKATKIKPDVKILDNLRSRLFQVIKKSTRRPIQI
jgi:hypothetical protein